MTTMDTETTVSIYDVSQTLGDGGARQPAPWLHPNGALKATSFYETKHLKITLERLVDFDRINARGCASAWAR